MTPEAVGGPDSGESDELARIRAEYDRRSREVPGESWKVRMFIRQLRERALLSELSRTGSFPFAARRILDVGCGTGQWLADLETWGAQRESLAGIELQPAAAHRARARFATTGAPRDSGEADIREGSAAELPWPDGTFHIVLQATMLSSIVDQAMRERVASEMRRVLAPGGTIVSYDMCVGNPRNPSVRSVTKRDLAQLFDGLTIRTRRVTLALPVMRRLVGASWPAAAALERATLLNTHLLATAYHPDSPAQ
jgi:SAM-dependent methyltransferase